jgi:hypothetical protein
LLLSDKTSNKSWFDFMIENMQSGEFCLYATATLGPLYYFIFKEYPSSSLHQFPSGRLFMLIAAIILLLSGGLFAAQREGVALGKSYLLDHDLIYSISWKVYIVALVIVYLAHVYKNFLETAAAATSTSQTQDMVSSFVKKQAEKQ